MNINKEKEMIYEMMRDTMAERRKLTEIYWDLKERLDYLISLEERGLEELSLSGYADLHNKSSNEKAVENLKREISYIIEESNKKEKTSVEVEAELEKDKMVKRKGRKRISFEKVYSSVIEILKSKGTPIKSSDILERINRENGLDIKNANFNNNLMPRILNKNPKIDRVKKGYYQYKF